MYEKYFKRILDIIFSLIIIVVSSPVFLIALIVSFLEFKAPPVFIQERVGKRGVKFKMLKIRTIMTNINGHQSISNVCSLIRKIGIDEIPQFFNVLKGDMSIVGPRPLLQKDFDYLSTFFGNRTSAFYQVRPGITGLAQINGRKNISWERRVELNCKYAERIDFYRDLEIIQKTIKVLLDYSE